MPSIAWADFSGGLWIPPDRPAAPANFALPPNALLAAENIQYLESGAVRGRGGRQRVNAIALPGAAVGVTRYYPRPLILLNRNKGTLTVVADGPGIGSAVWQNPDRARIVDSQTAVAPLIAPNLDSHYLVATSLDLAVPADRVIAGFQVDVWRGKGLGSFGEVRDVEVRLLKNGAPFGENAADTSTNWPGTLERVTYRFSGSGWTVADVNDPSSGVRFACTASLDSTAEVDAITMAVLYEEPSPPQLIASYNSAGTLHHATFHAEPAASFDDIPAADLLAPAPRPHYVGWPQKGLVFIFDGVNPVQTFDGNALGSLAGSSNARPHIGPYACLWKNRLFATDPAELNFSVYATLINNERVWPPELQLACNDPTSGRITGVSPLQDRLVILKDTALFSFLGDIEFGGRLTLYSTQGCFAPESVQLTAWGIVYLGRGGVYLTDGASPDPVELSVPIRPLFIDNANAPRTYPNAIGIYFPRWSQYVLKLDPAAVDGWVLQRFTGPAGPTLAWAHLPVLPMNCACTQLGAVDGGELILGGMDGFVREADIGPSDEGEPIACTVRTMARPFDPKQDRQGRAYYVKPLYRGTQTLAGALRYDEAEVDQISFTAGQASAQPAFLEPRVTITEFATFGRGISVGLVNAGDGPEFELHALRLDTKLRTRGHWLP